MKPRNDPAGLREEPGLRYVHCYKCGTQRSMLLPLLKDGRIVGLRVRCPCGNRATYGSRQTTLL